MLRLTEFTFARISTVVGIDVSIVGEMFMARVNNKIPGILFTQHSLTVLSRRHGRCCDQSEDRRGYSGHCCEHDFGGQMIVLPSDVNGSGHGTNVS